MYNEEEWLGSKGYQRDERRIKLPVRSSTEQKLKFLRNDSIIHLEKGNSNLLNFSQKIHLFCSGYTEYKTLFVLNLFLAFYYFISFVMF